MVALADGVDVLALDVVFFGANALKIHEGGWVPLAIGAAPAGDQYSLGTAMAELVLRDGKWQCVSGHASLIPARP